MKTRGGGRVLLGDNTRGETVILRLVRFQCVVKLDCQLDCLVYTYIVGRMCTEFRLEPVVAGRNYWVSRLACVLFVICINACFNTFTVHLLLFLLTVHLLVIIKIINLCVILPLRVLLSGLFPRDFPNKILYTFHKTTQNYSLLENVGVSFTYHVHRTCRKILWLMACHEGCLTESQLV